MRASLLAAFIVFIGALAQPASAQPAGLQITPVVIQIAAERGIGSFRLHNGRERETAFEARAYAWTQIDGASVLTPTTDIILAPSTFVAAPGADQIIRIGAPRTTNSASIERAYRIIVRELPDPTNTSPGFRMVLEMSMPLFITPQGARGILHAERQGDLIVLRNNGAARLHLSSAPGDAGLANLPRYLLPGAEIIRAVRPGPLQMMSATAGDTAPQLVTIGPDHATVLAGAP